MAEHLDEALRRSVAEANPSGERILYVSRLDLFDQGVAGPHTLCGGSTEWLNRPTIGLYDPEYRGERSFHPNAPGHAATAEAIAQELDGRFSPATTSTSSPSSSAAPPTPPITSTETYEIGDAFEADCVVAWPTAPVRSSQGIEMTMSCSGVPHQFLFMDVFYADPDLPITPSTGPVHVRGRIVDVAESELGFRELVVQADDVQL